jgi:hypothetical protein
MTVMGYRAFFTVALFLSAAGTAQAQRNYDVKPMNFDLWCQETQQWPSDRCAKRLPDDVKTFEAFRSKIEAYEIPYLKKQDRDAHLSADILHNDPVDRPAVNTEQPPPDSQQAPPILQQ